MLLPPPPQRFFGRVQKLEFVITLTWPEKRSSYKQAQWGGGGRLYTLERLKKGYIKGSKRKLYKSYKERLQKRMSEKVFKIKAY